MAEGQDAKIEELKSRLNAAKHDTERVVLYYKLATKYTDLGNFNDAHHSVNLSIELGEKIHDKKGCAGAYNNQGIIFNYQGNYPEALKSYLKALRYAEEIRDTTVQTSCFINIGIIHGIQKDVDKSFDYFNKALELLKAKKDSLQLVEFYLNLSSAYMEVPNYNKAIEQLEYAEQIQEARKKRSFLPSIYDNIAICYLKLNQLEKAKQYINKAMVEATFLKDTLRISEIYETTADIAIHERKYMQAYKALSSSLVLCKKIGTKSEIQAILLKQHKLYTLEGRYKEALNAYKEYILYRDSLFNEDNTKHLVKSEMQYEYGKKEATLKAEQQIRNNIAASKLTQQRYILVITLIGFILILLVLWIIYQKRKTKQQIHTHHLENKTLRSQLNPHFIFNALTSIQKYLHNNPDLAQSYLARFSKLMRTVLECTEKEYVSLEEDLEMMTTYLELEQLRHQPTFQFQFQLDDQIVPDEILIPPFLYQPLLENAVKYGDYNHIGLLKIEFTKEQSFLKINISNPISKNVQISDQPEQKSYGIQIVRDRMALISTGKKESANLDYVKTDNSYTVIVTIPLLVD